ncbi:MAG: DUF1893 domain-containing protein, partial [Oscillospiraceae bacterium]|nr:DUF1893 domain-containing protein [Oscillospiraceae bacterium]
MMGTDNLKKAKELLESGGYTVVMCRGSELYTSSERGVKPLVELAGKRDMTGYSAADKIVGRAAAFLYVLLGVREVYAGVMSEGAENLLIVHGITPFSGCLTEKIINRTGNGLCPMENAVRDIPDDQPDMALTEILRTMAEL